jgi:hypothetical protein
MMEPGNLGIMIPYILKQRARTICATILPHLSDRSNADNTLSAVSGVGALE